MSSPATPPTTPPREPTHRNSPHSAPASAPVRYKHSRYNWQFQFAKEGDHYLFNGLSRALVRLTEEEWARFNSIQSSSPHGELSPRELEEFQRGHFLLPEEFDERAYLRHLYNRERFSSNTLRLTVAPTLRCNLRCFYCFEGSKPELSMTADCADQIAAVVERSLQRHAHQHVVVTWFGGEPLLNLPIIERLNRALVVSCRDRNAHYSSRIITNATLMTPAALAKLREGNLRFIQITLDGSRALHNKTRALPGRANSLDRIFANLEACAANGLLDRLQIHFRINVWRGMNDPTGVADLWREVSQSDWYQQGNCSIGFGTIRDHDGTKPDPLKISSTEWQAIRNAMGEVRTPPGTASLPQGFSLCAAVSAHSLGIGPAGELVKCWNSFGRTDESTGHISDLLYPDANPLPQPGWLQWLTHSPVDIPKCYECKLLPLCMGGCSFFARKMRGTSHHCPPADVEQALRAFVRQHRSRPTVEHDG